MKVNKHNNLTLKQLDELAVMAGGKVIDGRFCAYPCYRFSSGDWSLNDWHPETSLDACRPLLEEIERRGLGQEFEAALAKQCTASARSSLSPWLYYHLELTLNDYLAAFRKTIEEADGKEGE